MSFSSAIPAELRDTEGKGASRRLRRTGKVPAIVYGGDRDPQMLQLDHKFLLHAAEEEAFYTSILKLEVGKKTQRVLLRDLQRHPFKQQIMHLDFMRVSDDQAIRVHVPLHFLNEARSPAGKASGVVITHKHTELEVSCLPADLPEYIEVDLEKLDAGDVVKLSDIELPEGVDIPQRISDPEFDMTVVTAAHVSMAEPTTDEEAEGVEAAAEGDEAEGEDAEGEGAGEGEEAGDDDS